MAYQPVPPIQPIQFQPGVPNPAAAGGNWMPMPAVGPDIPHGLEYLSLIDHIFIKQRKEMLEIVTGWETNNKYVIMNGIGQQVYYAYEENDCCNRQCCGKNRGFVIHIVDNFGREVMRVNREFKCCAGWSWCAVPGSCCAHQVTIEAPPGNVIGTVSQRTSACIPAYQIGDPNGMPILNIDSPDCCSMSCGCGDKKFTVRTMQGNEIGAISKKWAGFVQEAFTDADNFGVSFPIDLSVQVKAALIGATFLIDFVHFETKPNNENRRRHHNNFVV